MTKTFRLTFSGTQSSPMLMMLWLVISFYKMLSYRRETALQGAL